MFWQELIENCTFIENNNTIIPVLISGKVYSSDISYSFPAQQR